MCLILQRTRTWLSLQTYVVCLWVKRAISDQSFITVLVSSSCQGEKEVSFECNS